MPLLPRLQRLLAKLQGHPHQTAWNSHKSMRYSDYDESMLRVMCSTRSGCVQNSPACLAIPGFSIMVMTPDSSSLPSAAVAVMFVNWPRAPELRDVSISIHGLASASAAVKKEQIGSNFKPTSRPSAEQSRLLFVYLT